MQWRFGPRLLPLRVTHAKIEVEPYELPPVQACFHRVARTAVRRPIKVHDRFADHEPKEVSRVPRGSVLQGPEKSPSASPCLRST